MNVAEQLGDAERSLTPEHIVYSDDEGEDDRDDHLGDYSTRLEELMSDEDDQEGNANGAEYEDEDDEGFFYNGTDSAPAGTYREQLRDVLGPEHDLDDAEEPEVENSLIHDVTEKERFESSMDDEARVCTSNASCPPLTY